MHNEDFASRLVGTIQEREIAPRPRWTFTVQHWLLIILAACSVILGALTVATSEYLLVDRDWDIAVTLSERNTRAVLESLPYLWLATLILLVVVTYGLFTRTRRGYRFAPVTALGGSVVLSLVVGSGLYAAGFGPQAHEYARHAIPAYERLVVSRDRFWSNPAQGLLGGYVLGATTSEQFLLKDTAGQVWIVTVSEDDEPQETVFAGTYVRVLGAVHGTSTFVAERILPWERRVIASTTTY